MFSPLLKVFLFSGVFIAIAHFIANEFFLYWDFWWLDIVMHFLGGFWVGILFLLIIGKTINNPKRLIFLTVLASLFIGIFWEIFEYKTGLSPVGFEFWSDTLSDIFMDIIGGFFAGIVFIKKIK